MHTIEMYFLLIRFSVSRFVFRENRVPYYQQLFQAHDGKRQWWKVSPPTTDTTFTR